MAMTDALTPPWGAPTPEDEGRDGSYAEYVRWERWMRIAIDSDMERIGEDCVLDTLNGTQKTYLFNLMGRLSDGKVPRS
jgi:hypothetical protein